MARESVKILQGKLDVESLISQLNAALSEEWLAYYQYWVGALVVEGAMRADVQGEFEEHAEEERRHAQLLADRIIELEGVPVLDPKKWFELARCKYDAPQGFDSVSLLKDNVASERCAILRYQEIADFTNGKDFTTCDIAKHCQNEKIISRQVISDSSENERKAVLKREYQNILSSRLPFFTNICENDPEVYTPLVSF